MAPAKEMEYRFEQLDGSLRIVGQDQAAVNRESSPETVAVTVIKVSILAAECRNQHSALTGELQRRVDAYPDDQDVMLWATGVVESSGIAANIDAIVRWCMEFSPHGQAVEYFIAETLHRRAVEYSVAGAPHGHAVEYSAAVPPHVSAVEYSTAETQHGHAVEYSIAPTVAVTPMADVALAADVLNADGGRSHVRPLLLAPPPPPMAILSMVVLRPAPGTTRSQRWTMICRWMPPTSRQALHRAVTLSAPGLTLAGGKRIRDRPPRWLQSRMTRWTHRSPCRRQEVSVVIYRRYLMRPLITVTVRATARPLAMQAIMYIHRVFQLIQHVSRSLLMLKKFQIPVRM